MLEKIAHYLDLVKFHHTVFALPFALIAFFTALKLHQAQLSLELLFWVLVCMVSARTAAMAFNRLADREIDGRNPRTRSRHLPAGLLTTGEVWALTLGSILLFLLGCAMINTWTLVLSPFALAVLLGYSLTKYFTGLSHFFLGLALGLAPVGAWVAALGRMDWAPVVLGTGVLVWVAGFDILYALQDEEVDRKEGLYSLVVQLGREKAILLVKGLHVLSVVFFVLFGLTASLGWVYFAGVGVVVLALLWEHHLVRPDDISRINAAFFTVNGFISVALLVFTLVELYAGSL
jgi:4-hydroxybenzoate polyprenyltransferase